MGKHIAVTDGMKDEAGRIVYWRLSGEVDYDRLVQLWEDSDLSDLLIPQPTSAERALRLTCDSMKERHLLVRSLPGVTGYALVREQPINNSFDYSDLVHARLDKSGETPTLEVEEGPDAARDPEWCSLKIDAVVAEYERRLDTLDSMAVSSWLANKILPSVKAISLRDRGGVYFIPASECETWDAIVSILRKCSQHTMFQIPAMPSEEAVHAILDALTSEAADKLGKIESELGMGEEEAAELGKRAVKSREEAVNALLEKLEVYESLLDTRLDAVRDRIGTAQQNLTVIALSGDED